MYKVSSSQVQSVTLSLTCSPLSVWLSLAAGTKNWELWGYSSFPLYWPGQICTADIDLLTKSSEIPE